MKAMTVCTCAKAALDLLRLSSF